MKKAKIKIRIRRWNLIETVCKECDKVISIWPSVFNPNGNFCSRNCSNKYHSEIIRLCTRL